MPADENNNNNNNYYNYNNQYNDNNYNSNTNNNNNKNNNNNTNKNKKKKKNKNNKSNDTMNNNNNNNYLKKIVETIRVPRLSGSSTQLLLRANNQSLFKLAIQPTLYQRVCYKNEPRLFLRNTDI